MTRFTKELRQEIIREFSIRHNGYYNPALFVDDVRSVGPNHPAWKWFEWSDDRAAKEHRLWQARQFAQGLRIVFSVEEVGPQRPISVRETEVPMALSPGAGRRNGGGYYMMDADDPEHMTELCRQASVSLSSWLRRYEAAVAHAGGSVRGIKKQLKLLEHAAETAAADAA